MVKLTTELAKDPSIHCGLCNRREECLSCVREEPFVGCYAELYENSPIALYRTRIIDDKLLICNRAFVDLLGYHTRQECLLRCSVIKTHIDPKGKNQFMAQLESKTRIEGLQTQIHRNGSMLWVRINAELFWESGYIEGSMCDISVSKLLTPMEKEVLKILLQGSCNSEIAYILDRSIRTIEEHRARIMRKLGVHNIIELAKKSLMTAWQE